MPRSERAGRGGYRGRTKWGMALLAGAALALGACEGQGLYEPGTDPGPGIPGPGPQPPGTARGTLVTIPGVGRLADMVVDAGSGHVFLSNLGQHRIEVLRPDTLAFRGAVAVGSEPWGVSLNRGGDTLIVANSGGTNVSFVPLDALQEDVGRRFQIPRITLYEIDVERDADGVEEYTDARFFNYADRPQHIAQDSRGRLVYSAISTQAAPIGSVRVADMPAGRTRWDARLLFHERAIAFGDSSYVVFDADSVFVEYGTDRVVVWDHVPGTWPKQHVRNQTPAPVPDAVAAVRAQLGNAGWAFGSWRMPEAAALADTTYVAASGDRNYVVIGEGARDRPSRIMVWHAAAGRLPIVEDIADIVNNTSDFVHGVELNADGSLGVARGELGTYFFGRDLRLQGLTAAHPARGRGAAFLPGSTGDRTLAFEPTLQGTVRILETTHYRVIREIPVREAITGPFRVGPVRAGSIPCPADPAVGAEGCVVATVYGVTAGRRLLVLEIRREDLVQ
jgi:hypothetical protein